MTLTMTDEMLEDLTTDDDVANDIPTLTDVGNAARLVRRYGGNILFCHDRKRWLVWDGKRWGIDRRRRVATLAKFTIRAWRHSVDKRYEKAIAHLHPELTPQQRQLAIAQIDRTFSGLFKWAKNSQSRSGIEAMISLAEPDVATVEDELDLDQWLITVNNGTLDLRNGKLLSHDRKDRISKLSPVTYDETATCPTFLKFLDRVMAGKADLISFLQRAIGYSLTGSTKEQCFFIFHGAGANGKSTLLNVLLSLLGDYALATPTETLLVKKSEGPRNDVARLKGARLVSAVETEDGKRFAEALVKQMTGGDPITSRFLYGEFFEYIPVFKLFLAANYKPVVRGADLAIWRRIYLVPFEVTIPKHEQDGDLPDKLRAELPGILRWAIQGCIDWQNHGLKPPAAVLAATSAYRAEMDSFRQWLPATEYSEHGSTMASVLYNHYLDWCHEEGSSPISQTLFGRRLAALGLEKGHTVNGTIWKHIRLIGMPSPPDGLAGNSALLSWGSPEGLKGLTGSSNSSYAKE